MIPSWALTAIIVFVGCIVAYYVGSTLPNYDVDIRGVNLEWYILIVAVVCTIGAVTNDFPMLLAVGAWMPFSIPFASFSQFPVIVLVMGWISGILFFRLCQSGTLRYIKSFNLFFLIVFAWVPIRFLMNPVHKLGASVEGGSGVSGAAPYFYYVIAVGILVVFGAILHTREKIVSYMIWSFRFSLIIGVSFLICAFIPATGPFLYSWGIFAAGNLSDGILRIVQLPGYGYFLVQAAMCPTLFRLTKWQCLILLVLGSAMIVVGGNRSTVASLLVATPVLLILRRSTHALAMAIGFLIIGVIALRFTVDQMGQGEIPNLVRCFGIFDSKIDESTGGNATAKFRYDIWQSGIEKIMEHPVIGKGFGNLPKHLDPTSKEVQDSTDFEVILAGGEAHNGFVTAAYAFGIPFMAALTAGLFARFFQQIRMALSVDTHDKELRDLHALFASLYPAFAVSIYSALDMSTTDLWIYVAMGFILGNLPRASSARDAAPTAAQPAAPYLYPSRY